MGASGQEKSKRKKIEAVTFAGIPGELQATDQHLEGPTGKQLNGTGKKYGAKKSSTS